MCGWAPRRDQHTRRHRVRAAGAVAAHRRSYGDVCPGWRRPPHRARDLTADHIVAVVLGGDPDGPLQVLCRSCNAAKGVDEQLQARQRRSERR